MTLEPAARALLAFDSPGTDWDDLSPDDRETYLDGAKRIVEARYPELTDGSHWIAPRIPTDAMLNAGCDLIDDPSSHVVDALYTAMRGAYLEEQSDVAAGLEALKEPETASWDEVKDKLNLKDKPE